MDNSRGLGIARVALTVQVTISPDRLDALLRESDKAIGDVLASIVDAGVRERGLGYYPALEFLVHEGIVPPEQFDALRTLAAVIRKRVKRDVQTLLWPIFSGVQIERAHTVAFQLPRHRPGRPESQSDLSRHYFPNVVRLDLVLSSLDKPNRLEDAAGISEHKVMRNLLDHFESVSVSAVRRLEN